MTSVIKNLGIVKSIFKGTTPPINIDVIWKDTNPGINLHKYFNETLGVWTPLAATPSSDTTLFDTWRTTVKDTTITNPAILGNVQNHDRYLIPINSVGDWLGQDNKIATRVGSVWQFETPESNWAILSDNQRGMIFLWNITTLMWDKYSLLNQGDIKSDGTVAFTDNQSMNNNRLIDLADPQDPADAVTLSFLNEYEFPNQSSTVIVNDLITGGVAAALSAQQGVVIDGRLEDITDQQLPRKMPSQGINAILETLDDGATFQLSRVSPNIIWDSPPRLLTVSFVTSSNYSLLGIDTTISIPLDTSSFGPFVLVNQFLEPLNESDFTPFFKGQGLKPADGYKFILSFNEIEQKYVLHLPSLYRKFTKEFSGWIPDQPTITSFIQSRVLPNGNLAVYTRFGEFKILNPTNFSVIQQVDVIQANGGGNIGAFTYDSQNGTYIFTQGGGGNQFLITNDLINFTITYGQNGYIGSIDCNNDGVTVAGCVGGNSGSQFLLISSIDGGFTWQQYNQLQVNAVKWIERLGIFIIIGHYTTQIIDRNGVLLDSLRTNLPSKVLTPLSPGWSASSILDIGDEILVFINVSGAVGRTKDGFNWQWESEVFAIDSPIRYQMGTQSVYDVDRDIIFVTAGVKTYVSYDRGYSFSIQDPTLGGSLFYINNKVYQSESPAYVYQLVQLDGIVCGDLFVRSIRKIGNNIHVDNQDPERPLIVVDGYTKSEINQLLAGVIVDTYNTLVGLTGILNGQEVYVTDASGDPNPTVGWAVYKYIISTNTWIKVNGRNDIFVFPIALTTSTTINTPSHNTWIQLNTTAPAILTISVGIFTEIGQSCILENLNTQIWTLDAGVDVTLVKNNSDLFEVRDTQVKQLVCTSLSPLIIRIINK